ncbi:MAG: thioredoxin domain-containing protein [Deltaproteobacteria bacterium]|nr:thioredoxin domain-containing protein [Deltaproteobacteria bacterium]
MASTAFNGRCSASNPPSSKAPNLHAGPWRVVSLAAITVAAVSFAASTAMAQRSYAPTSTVYRVPVGKAPVLGPSGALVTIVVFADFQCPFCARALTTTIPALMKKHPKEIRLVFRHMPLAFHRFAQDAAEAAAEAHRQKKFWTYAALLWQNRRNLTTATLRTLALQAHLKAKAFAAAMQRHSMRSAVASDVQFGHTLGVRGTPTFFFNGVKIVGAGRLARFEAVYQAQAKRARAALKRRGITRKNLYSELIKHGVTRPTRSRIVSIHRRPPGRRWAPKGSSSRIVVDDRPILGNPRAPITVLWFTSLRCYAFYSNLQRWIDATRAYDGLVRLVFKHLPGTRRPIELPLARLAVEAYREGRFWTFATLASAARPYTIRSALAVARDAGLVPARAQAALHASITMKVVQEDAREAYRLGLTNRSCSYLVFPAVGGHTDAIRGYTYTTAIRKRISAALDRLRSVGKTQPPP